MTTVFWILLALVVYCYFGYPLLIWAVSKAFPRPVRKSPMEPTVSVILSVFNEEEVIERKLKNLLSLDYPEEKLEILVGSDGSTDRTNELVEKIGDPRVILLKHNERRGKMATLNDLAKKAKNEILLFTDARQRLSENAVGELVANFSDEKVGCVSGELIFEEKGKEGSTAKGIGLYWAYEKMIRKCESKVHSMLGATGAICALRRELYAPIPENIVLDDMYIPFQAIRRGFRSVLDESARAYDAAADSPRVEYGRKARTLFGNYQIFSLFKDMFVPGKSPIALQLFSHKLLRVVVPFLLMGIFVLNLLLIKRDFYRTVFYLQIVFYAMAAAGGLARYQKYGILNIISRVCYVPYVFCLLNFSALAGFFRYVTAGQSSAWKTAEDL